MDIKRQTLQHDFAPEWLKLPNQVSAAVKPTDQLRNKSIKRDELKNSVSNSKKTVNCSSRQESGTPRANGLHNGYVSHHGLTSTKTGRSSNQVHDTHHEKTSRSVAQTSSKCGRACAEQNSLNSDWDTNGINTQRSTSGVLDDIDNRNVSCMDSMAADNGSVVDEEFPSLVGDAADCSKPAFSRVLSVWDGISRECNTVNRSANSGEKVNAVKTPPPKIGAGKRAASDLELQASNSKTAAGLRAQSRRMTVLSASKDRQKEHQQPPSSLITSVSKVITCELEGRKSNYMKLVRRESQDYNGDGNRSESCPGAVVTVDGVSCKDAVLVDDSHVCNLDDAAAATAAAASAENDDLISSLTSSTDSVMMFSDEDERRLLCSMGWEECNDDNYELTEAEIAEVINMIKEKQKLTGQMDQANGCSKFHHVQKFTFDNRSRPQSTTIH